MILKELLTLFISIKYLDEFGSLSWNNIKEKHLEDSQIIKTIEFLATYSEPIIIIMPYIPVTDYNKKKVAILKKVQQVIQRSNKL